ncbi:MAG: hypothetical protein JWN74_2226 [Acidobacteriaceae bacterium]|nr:hypothetical protein [Acidobacteriaceae bacterium]
MSIAVLIGVHDGLVLAADSASTLTMPVPPGVVLPPGQQGAVVGNVYDNANKIFNLVKGQPIGCITFGSGNIGNASIGTLIKDLRKKLTDTPKEMGFNADEYTMEGVAKGLAKFLGEECDKLEQAAKLNTNMGFLLGGYSKPGPLGESWSVEIKKGVPQPPKKLRQDHEVGLSWGGATEVLQRMIVGFSPSLFQHLASVTQPPQNPAVLASQLGPVLTARMQANLVFAPMPIQDVIDLARFLVHSAIMFSRFSPGPNIVGGPIEIAAITKHENFKWISRKHYYDQPLNKEPIHVFIDK